MSRRVQMLVALLAVCVGAASVGAALAQPPGGGRGFGGPGGPGGGMMGGGGMLLRIEAVQKELNLTDDQKAKLQDAMSSMRPSGDQQQRPSMEEMQKRMADMQKTVEGILTPEQNARLKEISLQVQGARALANPEVANAVGLTDDQKQKLEQISNDSREKMRSLFGGGGNQEDNRAKMQQLMKDAGDAAMAVLTPEQKEKFEKMQGAKVNIDMQSLRSGPGGPGGRRGGGQQPQQ